MSGIVFEPILPPLSGTATLPALRASGVITDGPDDAGCWGYAELPAVSVTAQSEQPTIGLCSFTLTAYGVADAETVGFAQLPALAVSGDLSDMPEVDITFGLAYLPPLGASGTLTATALIGGEVELPAMQAMGLSDAESAGYAVLPALQAVGFSMSPARAGLTATLATPYAWIVGLAGQTITSVSATDSLAISEDPNVELIHVIVEQIRLSGAFDTLVEQLLTVRDGITLSGVVRAITVLHLSDTVQLGEKVTVTPELVVQLVDALLLASPTSSVHEINALVSTVLALLDAGADLHLALAEDGIELGDAVLYQARAYGSAIEELRLSAVASWSVVLVVTAQDAVSLSDSGVHFAEIAALVRSGVALLAHVSLADAPQIAWVMNTESRAVFTYDQWPFNSYAEFGGRHLAAGPDGIYLLAGDTDAGVPILAKVRTGLMDMGTSAKKRIESMYLGYSADGRMGLRVITTMPSGEKRAHDYVMKLRPADAATTNRIKIGRGHASRYYAFELSNVDGSDFTLNGAELLPMILDRRI